MTITRAITLAAALTCTRLGVAQAVSAQTPSAPAAAPAAHPAAAADVSSVDAILHSLYDVISGPAGQTRNWDRFRSLFYEGARLIPATPPIDGPPRARVLGVEDYISRTSGAFSQQGFYEREIARRVDQFGSIVQVSARTNRAARPMMRSRSRAASTASSCISTERDTSSSPSSGTPSGRAIRYRRSTWKRRADANSSADRRQLVGAPHFVV
jgi:hypothetical protein